MKRGIVALGVASGGLLAGSLFLPWWKFWLYAPQYPKGLTLVISLTGMGGDVHEIDLLNHYIGMRHLADAAPLERQYAGAGVAIVVALTIALAALSRFRLNRFMALPALALPLGFLADSFYWLYTFGHDLDPKAPLEIGAFTPELFGNGKIGQFETFAQPAIGFWLAVAGVALALVGSVLRAAPTSGKGSGRRARRAAALAVAGVALALVSGSEPARAESAASAASFADLRARVEAPDGPAVIALAPGVYRGDLVIARPLTIRGGDGVVLEGTGSGTVVTVRADDVTVEDVAIRRSGRRHTAEDAAVKATGARVHLVRARITDALFGVSLEQCRDCVLDRVRVTGGGGDTELRGDGIKLWESHGSVVKDCVVHGARDVVVWYTRHATLERNVVEDGRYGTHFMYAHDAVVKGGRFERNVVGVFVMYSMRMTIEDVVVAGAHGAAGVGLGFKDSDRIDVRRSWMVANTTGIYLDNTPRTPSETVTFEHDVVALNEVGVRLHSAEKGLRIVESELRGNGALVEVDGGGDALAVDVRRNWYSDYEGYDLDGDGIGDVAYEVKALSSELTEAHPALKLFRGTPAMGLIDAVAHAAPVLAARKLWMDPEPRMGAR